MAIHNSKFRLSSSAFERNDEKESEKIDPKRMIILSVEGDETERTYFQHLNEHLENSLVKIEILRHRRGDGYSDPEYVIELLNEYISVREGELIPENLPEAFTKKYSKELIEKYLNNCDDISRQERKAIREDLILVGIDLDYRRYLQSFHNENDFFAVILDRDQLNHSLDLLRRCKKQCDDKHYGFFMSNPCFEFWLLLHFCNPKEKCTEEELQLILENPKVTCRKNQVGIALGEFANHGKSIGKRVFDDLYFQNIGCAVRNAKAFSSTFPELYDSLGTNLPELLEKIGFTPIIE